MKTTLEDRLLKWRFKQGSKEALERIYEKYLDYLVNVAANLLNDLSAAEDVVHDFFVGFAQSSEGFKLEGSLKWYLTICVLNRSRDECRKRKREADALSEISSISSNANGPESSASSAIREEEIQQLHLALGKLPYEERESIIAHLIGGMTFKEIAKFLEVSLGKVQGKYCSGLNKLKLMLNSEEIK